MTCKDVSGMLDRLMDGELTEEEQRELRAHGQTCPECADEIRAAFEMKALFDEAQPEADVPLAVQAKWRGAIREAAKQDKRKKLTRWISSAAAAVVVLVGVGLALNGSLAPKRNAATQYATVEVAQEAAEAGEANEAPVANRAAALDAGGAAEVDSAAEVNSAEAVDSAAEVEPAAGVDSANEAAVIETDGAQSLMGALEAPVGSFASKSAEASVDAEEDMAVAAPEAEAYEDAEAFEDAEAAEEAVMEEAPMCAALAQQSPACEYAIQTRSVDIACELIGDLAGEFEGAADVQSVEGGSANVYVELDARYAAEFLAGVAKLDDGANPASPPELTGEGQVLVLIVVAPVEE